MSASPRDIGAELCTPRSRKHHDFVWSDTDITVFGGSAGSGKAQPLDAKVLTPSGWTTMGEVDVGSVVSTPNGVVAKVVAAYKFDSKPVYAFNLEGDRTTRACYDHLWKVEVITDSRSFEGVYATKQLLHFLDCGYDVYIPVMVNGEAVAKQLLSIDWSGYEAAQCISLDSEDHLYITDDYIVTHNTWQGLVRFLQFVNEPEYVGYVIRKTQASLKFGAFKTAIRLFTAWDNRVKINRVDMTFKFPSGCTIIFKGLDGNASIEYFQGQEISGALVDEATHIKFGEIEWLMTRLRTNAKNVKPSIWFTCNPDPDHFIAKWVDPYLYPKKTMRTDPDTGRVFDIGGRVDPEKNGKTRYYYVIDGLWVWDDDRDVLIERCKNLIYDKSQKPMSFKFIGATCHDNPVLLEEQPDYLNNMLNKSKIEVERLVFGKLICRSKTM